MGAAPRVLAPPPPQEPATAPKDPFHEPIPPPCRYGRRPPPLLSIGIPHRPRERTHNPRPSPLACHAAAAYARGLCATPASFNVRPFPCLPPLVYHTRRAHQLPRARPCRHSAASRIASGDHSTESPRPSISRLCQQACAALKPARASKLKQPLIFGHTTLHLLQTVCAPHMRAVGHTAHPSLHPNCRDIGNAVIMRDLCAGVIRWMRVLRACGPD